MVAETSHPSRSALRRWLPSVVLAISLCVGGYLAWSKWQPKPAAGVVYIAGPRATCIQFSPDRGAKYVAATFSDGRVRIWETATEKELAVKLPSTLPLNDIAWTADGINLFVGGFEQHILMWNVKSKKASKLPIFDAPIVSLAFCPQQSELLASLSNGELWRIDLETGDRASIPTGHTGVVKVVRFHPAGKLFATGGADKQLIWHDAITHQVTKTVAAHQHEISSLSFSKDGSQLVTGSWDNTAKVWAQAADEPTLTLNHPNAVAKVAWLGPNVMTSSWDRRLRLWNVSTKQVIKERECLSDTLAFAVWQGHAEQAEIDDSGTLRLTAP